METLMFSGIILSYQTLTGCKLEYLPTDSPEEPDFWDGRMRVHSDKRWSSDLSLSWSCQAGGHPKIQRSANIPYQEQYACNWNEQIGIPSVSGKGMSFMWKNSGIVPMSLITGIAKELQHISSETMANLWVQEKLDLYGLMVWFERPNRAWTGFSLRD